MLNFPHTLRNNIYSIKKTLNGLCSLCLSRLILWLFFLWFSLLTRRTANLFCGVPPAHLQPSGELRLPFVPHIHPAHWPGVRSALCGKSLLVLWWRTWDRIRHISLKFQLLQRKQGILIVPLLGHQNQVRFNFVRKRENDLKLYIGLIFHSVHRFFFLLLILLSLRNSFSHIR